MHSSNAYIAVIDSNQLFRSGLASMLNKTGEYIAREASDISDLETLAKNEKHFDVTLIELPVSEPDPTERIQTLRRLMPNTHIVILADTLNIAQLCVCFQAKVDGFLLKNISYETLVESLKLVLLNEKVFPSSLSIIIETFLTKSSELANIPTLSESLMALSNRELEILQCLIDGDSNKRIAIRLNIAEATVKVHVKSVLRKTRVTNRTQAAIFALSKGLSSKAPSVIS